MIQIKRGQTANWRASDNILADGQPGYDRNKNKIKIGNGISTWSNLKYASGLNEEDILLPESKAKTRYLLDPEDSTLITYGPDAPDKDTVGQIYLQQYESAPEVDYVVSQGINGIWSYQKWNSGKARCSGVIPVNTTIQEAFENINLYSDNKAMKPISYPFKFIEDKGRFKVISEIATVQSPGSIVWLVCRESNTTTKSGAYSILSTDKQINSANYNICIHVEGFWK